MKYPNTSALIVRQTALSLTSTGLQTFRRFVIPEAEKAHIVEYYGGSSEKPAQYRYPVNGSTIFMGGMDKPDKIMSSEYDLIYVQEATELSITAWEQLTTRLGRATAMPYAQLLADCNPNSPKHWLRERCNSGSTVIFMSRHQDNPLLYNSDGTMTERGKIYIQEKLEKLTGVRRKRLLHGLWVAAEGTVYEEQWDEAVHVIDRFEIPDSWSRIWSVDFGFVHPFVLQCWAIDPEGTMYLYREIVHTRRTVLDHAKTIMGIVAPGSTWDSDGRLENQGEWIEPRPDWVVTDHDAEGRETLERAIGFGVTPADKRVETGVDTVQERIKRGALYALRDSVVERDPRMVDLFAPIGWPEEILSYVWNTGGGRLQQREPLKDKDDCMDAGRYAVMSIDGGGSPGIRWF
jgi:phage terminase large subunit